MSDTLQFLASVALLAVIFIVSGFVTAVLYFSGDPER